MHRLNKAKSVYIFGQHHPFRKFSLYITTNQYPFDKVVGPLVWDVDSVLNFGSRDLGSNLE